MATTITQLKRAAQEMIDVMHLTDTDENGNEVPVKLPIDETGENYLDTIKECIEWMEEGDHFSKETVDLIEEISNLKKGEKLQIERTEEVLPEITLDNEVHNATTIKQLKQICQTEPIFKVIRGKLSSFKNVEDLRDDMIMIMNDKMTAMTEQELPLKDDQQETVEKIHKKNIEDASVKVGNKPYVEEDIMSTLDLVMIKPFKDLFETSADVLKAVSEDMAKNGFDRAFPLILWENVVIDGHTRLKAAMANSIERVPVVKRKFKNEKEALEYAIHNQRDRRNLSEAELLRCIEALDKPMSRQEAGKKGAKVKSGEAKEKEMPTHKKTAKILNIGESKVTEARKVLKDKKAKQDVESGKKTIHKAAQELKEKKSPKKKVTKTPEKTRIECIAKVVLEENGKGPMDKEDFIERALDIYVDFNGEEDYSEMKKEVDKAFEFLFALGFVAESEDGDIEIKIEVD